MDTEISLDQSSQSSSNSQGIPEAPSRTRLDQVKGFLKNLQEKARNKKSQVQDKHVEPQVTQPPVPESQSDALQDVANFNQDSPKKVAHLGTPEPKLYNLRTLEGLANKKAITAIREIEEKLGSNKEFVGLALNGSLGMGYSTPDSDVDLTVLYDSSLSDGGLSTHRNLQKKYELIGYDTLRDPEISKRQEVDLTACDVNPQVLADTNDWHIIFKLTTGRKIDQYRKYWTDYLQGLSEQDREQTIKDAANKLADKDAMGWEKMARRTSGISGDDFQYNDEIYKRGNWRQEWHQAMENSVGVPKHGEFKRRRFEQWQKRILSFFGENAQNNLSEASKEKTPVFH